MDKVNFNPFSEILVEDFLRQSDYIGDAFELFIADFLCQNTAVLGLDVTAQAVPNMTVYVKPGRIYQAGLQGQLLTNLDPALAITAAHPTYARIDRICAQYRESSDTPETRNVMIDTVSRQVTQKTVMTRVAGTIDFLVVPGVAAPGPAAPTVPDGWTSLAQVNVRANTTSVLQTDIVDERPILKSLATHGHSGGIDGAKIDYNSLLNRPTIYSNNWKGTTAYAVGDICYSPAVSSYKRFECTVAGTSGTTEPTWPAVGSTIADGTVTWKVVDIKSFLSLSGGSLSGVLNEMQGANIASAATTDIGSATGNFVQVTGTTTITALGTVQAGSRRTVEFMGSLTLTHNATSLILPGASNIITTAGDIAHFISLGGGNWLCVGYQPASLVQFDNSTKLATTAFLKRAGVQHSNSIAFATNTTLTAANAGSLVIAYGNTGPVTFTLPLSSTLVNGATLYFLNASGYPVTIVRQGTDLINPATNTQTSIVLQPGDTFNISLYGTVWETFGGSAQAIASGNIVSGGTGWTKLADGTLIQRGTTSLTDANGYCVATFPLTFFNTGYNIVATHVGSASVGICADGSSAVVSSCGIILRNMTNTSGAGWVAQYIAIGRWKA